MEEKKTTNGKRNKIIIGCAGVVLVIAISVIVYLGTGNLRVYNNARKMMDNAQYYEAIQEFEQLGDYKDSYERIFKCSYHMASSFFEEGKYLEALEIFTALKNKNYKDSDEQKKFCEYKIAEQLYNEGDYPGALEYFRPLAEQDFQDSAELVDSIENGEFSLNQFVERYNQMADIIREKQNVVIVKLDPSQMADNQIKTGTGASITFNGASGQEIDCRYNIESFMWYKKGWLLLDVKQIIGEWFCCAAGFTPDSTYDSAGDIISSLTESAGSDMFGTIDYGSFSYNTSKTKAELTLSGKHEE